jgi:hypothetical protein
MNANDLPRKYHDGRDEMNLADFPISALQRQQKTDGDGQKLDRLEFAATRYDPVSHQRVAQKVTLTTSARDGLPTPADEHVILALLYVAKHSNNFDDPTVRFAPSQLFDIMGWAPNGRSYERLRDVLRRLKSLTIRYENAWWDAAGRGYEEEVATGIVSAYRIARQVSGPRTTSTVLQSWVTWTQQFHDSLKAGNLKRLDLDVFFRLGSPTAQRMYRFLDKRFYNNKAVALDLVEFACGHVGLTESHNVAILKRRLAPAIAELEEIGFLAPLPQEERYQKVKAGIWRVHFQAGPGVTSGPGAATEPERPEPVRPPEPARPVRARKKPTPLPAAVPVASEGSLTAAAVAQAFYAQWSPDAPTQPGPRDLEMAELLAARPEALELVRCLVQVTRKEWPDCRSFSGAVQKYLGDALKLYQQEQQRQAARTRAEQLRLKAQEEQAAREREEQRRQEIWNRLTSAEQEAIRRKVQASAAGAFAPEAFLRRLCLEEAARQHGQPA